MTESESMKLYSDNHLNYSTQNTPNRLIRNEKAKWTPLLITTGITTTLGASIPCGYNIGVVNAPAKFIKSWCNETIYEEYSLALSEDELDFLWATIVSIFLIGGAIGSLGGAWVSNKLGRKKSFFTCCVLYVLGAMCFQTCRSFNSVELLLGGRLLVGLAAGLTTTTIPMYCAEIAPIEIRGTLSVLVSMGVTSGVVVGQIMSLDEIFGEDDLWQFALSCPAIVILLCLIPYRWLPESPKYLLCVAGKPALAEEEIIRLRGNNNSVRAEMEHMNPTRCENIVEKRSVCSVLRDKRLTLPLILTCALQGGQQLSGINAVFYYSVELFESVGLSLTKAQFANLGAGSINLIVAMFSPILMTKVNRRPLVMLSIGVSAFFLFCIMTILLLIESANWLKYACIVAIFGYIVFYQLGLGPIPYFIATELFEVGPRPVGMALGSLSSWLFNFVVGILFPTLESLWGAFVFLPFATTCVLMTVLVYFYLPETRNRDPSVVAPLMSHGFHSRIH